MPVTQQEFRESLAERLESVARERRDAAKQAKFEDDRKRLNRGSADLVVAAEHVRRAPVEHVDLSNLHAWEDAQDPIGQYRWEPNKAQVDAIWGYADDASIGPDGLLAQLDKLRNQ